MSGLGEVIYMDGNDYHPALLKDLKKGDFFVRKAGAKRVYTRQHYDQGSKTYSCHDYMDWNREIFLRGDTLVYVDFTY
jgi:hypothetical protein